jgi:hypothetical protein
MAILRLRPREPTTTADTSAAAALANLRISITELQADDARWARQETDECRHVRAADEAQAALLALEQRRVDAQADREVLGSSDVDVVALTKEIDAARTTVGTLRDRAQLAHAKVLRIRQQRATLHEQHAAAGQALRPTRHAAAVEALGHAMVGLVEAEKAYVSALVAAYSLAAVIDDLARQPGPRLAFADLETIKKLVLPRPAHHAFVAIPSSLKTIATALEDGIKQAEAEL